MLTRENTLAYLPGVSVTMKKRLATMKPLACTIKMFGYNLQLKVTISDVACTMNV
jgi:hypothetical protein